MASYILKEIPSFGGYFDTLPREIRDVIMTMKQQSEVKEYFIAHVIPEILVVMAWLKNGLTNIDPIMINHERRHLRQYMPPHVYRSSYHYCHTGKLWLALWMLPRQGEMHGYTSHPDHCGSTCGCNYNRLSRRK